MNENNKCLRCEHEAGTHGENGCSLCYCRFTPQQIIGSEQREDMVTWHYSLPSNVLRPLAREREKQNNKWGEQNHTDEIWLAILSEEIGEVSQAMLHNRFGGHAAGTLRKELIQVAAVAIQWLECINRNGEIVDGEAITPVPESEEG